MTARCRTCGEAFYNFPDDIETVDCQSPVFCAEVKKDDAQRAKQAEETAKQSFGFVDGEGWNDPPPPQEWTVDQRFPRRETVLFSGNGGAGKSTIGLHLACAHAIGKDWMHALPELGPAMFVDAEDDETVIRRRTYAIAQHYGVKPSDLFDGGLKIISLHGKDAVLASPAKGLLVPTDIYKRLLEAAVVFNPQTIVIASAANFYGGNEIDRSQVTQFIGLMNRLATAANGSVVLISHPSVLGMESDSGLSGSTQWHNAVRARMYLKSANGKDEAKANGDGAHETDLRQLEFRKNQYGPASATLTLRWKDGLFLPEAGPSSFDRAVRDSQINDAFRDCFAKSERDGMIVSATAKAPNFAPHVFAQMEPAVKLKISKAELAEALARALANGSIHIQQYGKPSNPHFKLASSIGPASVQHGPA